MNAMESKDIEYGGQKYRVWIEHDPDSSPYDYDCYDNDAKSAWLADEWQYVIVFAAKICGECGDATIEPVASLGSVEYGHLGDDITISLETIIESDYMSYQEQGSGEWITLTMIDGLISDITDDKEGDDGG